MEGQIEDASSDGAAVPNPLETPRPPENDCAVFPDGVKVLHDPTDAVVDICFIHGLTGNRESTWMAKGQDKPWPALFLASILSARILTYGFNAYWLNKGTVLPSVNRLVDHATNFLLDLTNDRAACRRIARPLIIVAHSMGGLVCKQALLLSRNHSDVHFRDMFNSLKGIVFMGTPHRGSWMANWAATPVRALGIFRPTNKSLLEILETENQFLEAIQRDFLSMLRHQLEQGKAIEITCFFEELPTFESITVVRKESAILEGYGHYSIHATHADMVKFASAEETGFRRVSGELLRWQESITAPKTKTARPRPPKGPNNAVKVKNMKAGKGSTQILEADRLNAEGITAGDHSLQILSPEAKGVLAACQTAPSQRIDVEASSKEAEGNEEGNTVMVPATSAIPK